MTGDALRHPSGRRARIALLLYGSPDHDSRVLKSARALQEAGAEVLIVARAIAGSGAPEGYGQIGDLPVYRTGDLDLPRTLAEVPRWLRSRGRLRGAPEASSSPVASDPAPGTRRTGPAGPPPSGSEPARPGLRARVGDLYGRGYAVVRLLRYWAEAMGTVRELGPDVVHANDGNTLLPAALLRLTTGARVVYDSHELWTRRNVLRQRWVAGDVEAVIERVCVRSANAVVTVSDSIADWMYEHLPLRRRPSVVRNIPQRSGPVPQASGGRLRELAGLTREEQVIVYCGGLTTGRGLEETIAALPHLPERMHLVLLGAGSPEYVQRLVADAQARGVGARVHLVGRVPSDQVPATIADADVSVVLVQPICLSYRFALPNKLFESIHAGLPVVAADLPDMATLVRQTRVGEVFDVDDPRALAAAIEAVVADPAPYREAAARAAEELDWRFEAERLIRAHQGAVRGFLV